MRAPRLRRTSISLAGCEVCEARLYLSAETVVLLAAEDVTSSNESVETLAVAGLDAEAIAALQAEYGLTGSGQTVVIIDTGVAYDHEALGGGYGAGYLVVGGYDFAEDDSDPYDDAMGHGTVVAGILAGESETINGLASGVDLVALRVFDDSGYCNIQWVEEALQWVLDNLDSFENPITTINLSLGVNLSAEQLASVSILEDELAALNADGIFISVAAGNSFTTYASTGLAYPASSPSVVAAASVDANGSLSYYSQRDAGVIAAPGRSILSCVPDYLGDENGIGDDYARYSGTSMAAPYVAAASVLLRQAYASVGVENVTQDTIYQTMTETADMVYDSITGLSYYRLNLTKAIGSVMALQAADDTAAESGTEAESAETTDETAAVTETEPTTAGGSQTADVVQNETDTTSQSPTDTGTGESSEVADATNDETVVQDPSDTSDGELVAEEPADASSGEVVAENPADTSGAEVVDQEPADGAGSEPVVQDPAEETAEEVVTQDPTEAAGGAPIAENPTDTSATDSVGQNPVDEVVTTEPTDGSGERVQDESPTENVEGAGQGTGAGTGTGGHGDRVANANPPAEVVVGTQRGQFVIVRRFEVSTSMVNVQLDLPVTAWDVAPAALASPCADQDQVEPQVVDSLYRQDWIGGGMSRVEGLDEIAMASPLGSEGDEMVDLSWMADTDYGFAAQEV